MCVWRGCVSAETHSLSLDEREEEVDVATCGAVGKEAAAWFSVILKKTQGVHPILYTDIFFNASFLMTLLVNFFPLSFKQLTMQGRHFPGSERIFPSMQEETLINLNHAAAQDAVYTHWHANAPADCHTQSFFFFNSLKAQVLYYTFLTFQLAFILSVSLFNKVFWFIADGCLYFVLIIGCYWKDEFHWFCGWLGALPSQTLDCQQGLCWVGIDATESPLFCFLFTSVSIDWNMQ